MWVQFVVLGMLGVGIWCARCWMKSEVARVDGEMRRAQRILGRLRKGTLPKFHFDPVTGHYYPPER
jgi:type IV secretory pathway TrbD component